MKVELRRGVTLLAGLVAWSAWGALAASGLSAEEKSLAEQLPRIPPQSPQEAQATFEIQRGFRLELVAAEPDVVDPIDAAFDEDGRMYVVEMRDYPFQPQQRAAKYVARQPELFGSIRLLEDADGDGKMDRSVVFADKLRWPQSVCCYRGGVFVLAPPTLYYMKDANGDGVADVREEWFTGFGIDNVQGLANGLEWSLDHGIYFAGGRAGAEIRRGEDKLFMVGRRDIRLDPTTKSLTPVSGGEQYGHSFDDWGNRFVCNNSNHLEQVLIPLRYLERNPQLAVSSTVRTIAKEGAAAPVFRKSPAEPWRIVRTARRAADPQFRNRLPATELVATGFFTSATGVTVYRGGAYPPEYRGNVFIGDVGGNLVHRKRLTANGVAQLGERTEEGVEFLTSTDNWFRPTNFVNAPDGTLYILDMYWETIEHPASIPEDIKEHLDLESGNDRGRIYRLVAPAMTRHRPPKLSKATTTELVAHLRSPHGWERDSAHRLLWERQDQAATAPLRALVRDAEALPQARIHALWSLQGLNALQPGDVLTGLKDAHPRVREQAIALSETFRQQPDAVLPALTALVNDDDLRVRWQLAFTLGEFTGPSVVAALKELAQGAGQDADMRIAILSSVPQFAPEFAAALLADPQMARSPLTVELLRSLGSAPKAEDVGRAFSTLLTTPPAAAALPALLPAFADGLKRRGGNLVALAESPGVTAAAREAWGAQLARMRQAVADAQAPAAERETAARLLAYVTPQLAAESLSPLLAAQTPPALLQQAVRSLAGYDDDAAAGRLIEAWRSLGPAARRDAIDGLTQTRHGARALLAGLTAGTVKPAELDRDKQQLLTNYPQADIRDQARKLLSGGTSPRREVVAKYQPALALSGDAERGQTVYKKICIQCHRVGMEGFAVGPDLVSVQNKSPDDLLIAILDPNREAQSNFISYTASTHEGRVFSGIIAAETAANIVLRRAEAKEDTVLRDQIDEFVSNGVSLMPEGMEKDISPEQLADVLAFIKALKAPTGGK